MKIPQVSWAVSRFNRHDSPVKRGVTYLSLLAGAGFALLSLTGCEAQQAAPVHHFGTQLDSAGSTGAVMVREGDTVWRISERYRLPLRDIIDINGLSAPYHLNAGQRLQLPPPREYKVATGDTVTGIARMYGVPASQLVSTNKLSAPYGLKEGQVLRIPAAIKPAVTASAATTSAGASAKPAATTAATQAAPPVTSAPPQPLPPETARVYPPPQTTTPAATAPTTHAKVSAAAKAPASMVSTGPASAQGFVWPVRGKIISSYGPKPGHLHNDGINIAAPRGAAIAAAADGTVTYVGDGLASYGNLVLIRHGNGLVTAYAHLDRVHVARGDVVKRGQAIGTVGSTGTVANPQLHFEVRKGIESLNPAKYLGS